MRESLSRRRLLVSAAAGLSSLAATRIAHAQLATQPPPKRGAVDEYSVTSPVSIEVKARPIASFDPRDRSHLRFGSLEYRSGLVLTSGFRGFGGLSGIRLDAKGERFVAISDKGGWFDSESIALDGLFVYIGLERVNQLLRYDFSRGFTRARGEVVPLPAAAKKLPYNKGLEALVVVPKGQPLAGTLIAISERGLDPQGNLIAFLIGGPSPGQFSVRRTENFDVSDAVLLPTGDLLILERKFSWLGGLSIRIRRVPLASVAPGAVIDGPAIFNADLGQEIDNFEGIDAHVTPEGETVLTLVSDDNFSPIQRTLLMQFTLVE
jgi:hypothetical protein